MGRMAVGVLAVMRSWSLYKGFRLLRWMVVFYTLLGMSVTQAQDAASLQARHAQLREQLANNPFQRPLYLESSDASGELKGDAYALLEQPYAVVGAALRGVNQWCDVLILHLNVKSCHAATTPAGDTVSLNIGRKFDRPLAKAYQLDFIYQVMAASPEYLQAMLSAKEGPLGTSDYRIVLEVVALDAQRSFLHLSYSYRYGMMASAALRGYLATSGRAKVGFSIVGVRANHRPIYIDGMRGVVERNTMRYYLAIEAYLGAVSTPARQQVEQRLNDWFTSIERYPLQLHELERSEYLDMKHRQLQREGSSSAAATK